MLSHLSSYYGACLSMLVVIFVGQFYCCWPSVFSAMFCRSLFVVLSLCLLTIVCPSSIYGFWLPLGYLQTFLIVFPVIFWVLFLIVFPVIFWVLFLIVFPVIFWVLFPMRYCCSGLLTFCVFCSDEGYSKNEPCTLN